MENHADWERYGKAWMRPIDFGMGNSAGHGPHNRRFTAAVPLACCCGSTQGCVPVCHQACVPVCQKGSMPSSQDGLQASNRNRSYCLQGFEALHGPGVDLT